MFYAALLLGGFIGAYLLIQWMRRPGDEGTPADRDLEPYELAFLAGGRKRAADALSREGPLPEPVSQQVLAVDLRFRRSGDGLVPRRGLSVVHGMLPGSGHCLLGIRWAGHGERWFRLLAP